MKVVVNKEDAYLTLKEFLLNKGFSPTLIRKYKNRGKMLVNGEISIVNRLVFEGDVVELLLDDENTSVRPEKMDLHICYEDEDILVVNKDAGIVVHPTAGHPDGTLANGVAWYYEKNNIKAPIRPVNRLDRDTSGLIIFAKNPFMQNYLQIVSPMKKLYIAIVEGDMDGRGTIDLPIKRKPGSTIERMVDDEGDTAVTHFRLLKRGERLSLVKLELKTGRTHQIRVHLSHIGHPIIGDTLYGSDTSYIKRQALHAYRLTFKQPFIGKCISLYSPIPDDMKAVLKNAF
ncbi:MULTISPECIES: RluA family pseudouridine synthase [unclassified Thermoanaerobacterium]|uniref:RluA family pseudouridine synthase n=1 Tax=unclassified Thermoanaerobacterium TaxID=2622527 RepID=UPI000A1606B1|nr:MULTISPECIES: RluA family pseudouridine synthase [unclassified Thermoanaerobacterium]MDE4542370.1 RluA family pseudouridine synthase [Thermoanaerobacterium sp. R66]ORX24394.1 RNA pseudouridine synthase [Thermoanaerobacterium sp. PSU-2]